VFYHLEAANKARERTVLVVNADHLTAGLSDWRVSSTRGRITLFKNF
jgi:hypothetical protein